MEGSSNLSPEHLAQHQHISSMRKLLDYYINAPIMLDEESDPDDLIAGLRNFAYKQSDETGGGCIISMKIRFLFLYGYEPLVEFGQGEKAFSKLLRILPKILALNCSESMDKQLNTSQREKVDQQKSNENANDKQNDNRILEATNSRKILNDKTDSRAGFNVPIIAILESDTHHQNKGPTSSISVEIIENAPSPNNNYEEQFRNKVEDWLLNKSVENPESVEGNSAERLMCESQMSPVDQQQESNEIPSHPNINQQQQLFQDPNPDTMKKINPLQCIYYKKICLRRQDLEVHLKNHTGEHTCRGDKNTKKHQVDRERKSILEELSKLKNSINSSQGAEQQKTFLALPEIPSCTMNEMNSQLEISGENENSSPENKDESRKVKNPLRCQFCFRKFISIPSTNFHEKGCSKAPQTNNQLPSASNQLNSPLNTNLQSSRKNTEQDNLKEEIDDEEMQLSPPQIGNDTSLLSQPLSLQEESPHNSDEASNFDDEMAGSSRQLRKSIRTGNTEKKYDYYEDEEENDDYFVPGRNSTKSKGNLHCPFCGQCCDQEWLLQWCVRSHTDPFTCKFCPRRFAEQRLCTRHEVSCQAGTNRGNQRIIAKRAPSEPAQHVNAPKRLRMEQSSAAASYADNLFLHSTKNSLSGRSSASVSDMKIFNFQEKTFFCQTTNCNFASTSESELQSHLSIEHGLPSLSPGYNF